MALFHTTVLDNQIKALDTIGSASGSIATFDTDRAERLVSCVCEVASGASEINVYHTGANLWVSGDVTFTGSTKEVAISLTPKTYYFSAIITTTDTDADTCSLVVYYTDNTYIAVTGLARDKRIFTSFTATKDVAKLAFYSSNNYAHGSGDTATWSDIQISENGNTYNIPFGETLSGNGSFDVLSGILTRSDDTTKQLSANYIQTNNGINNIYADTGDIIDLKFVLSVGKAIS